MRHVVIAVGVILFVTPSYLVAWLAYSPPIAADAYFTEQAYVPLISTTNNAPVVRTATPTRIPPTRRVPAPTPLPTPTLPPDRVCGEMVVYAATPITSTSLLTGTTDQPVTIGRDALDSWRASQNRSIAVFGDSWVENGAITDRLTTWAHSTYGDGGVGYIGVGRNSGASLVPYARTGKWMDCDQTAGSRGVEITDATSRRIAEPGTLTITTTATTFGIQYLRQIGGGTFRYAVDDSAWHTVNTSHSVERLGVAVVRDLPAVPHVLRIEVVSVGAVGVTLLGVDARIDGGVQVHRLGNGSLTSSQAVSVSPTIWRSELTALDPGLVMILLGTNDLAESLPPTVFRDNIAALVANVRDTLPGVPIVLIVPGDTQQTTPYHIADYAAALRTLAASEGLALFDVAALLGSYDLARDDGLYRDPIHLNRTGGKVVADALIEQMLR